MRTPKMSTSMHLINAADGMPMKDSVFCCCQLSSADEKPVYVIEGLYLLQRNKGSQERTLFRGAS